MKKPRPPQALILMVEDDTGRIMAARILPSPEADGLWGQILSEIEQGGWPSELCSIDQTRVIRLGPSLPFSRFLACLKDQISRLEAG